jgi:hypothetical protein
LACESQLKACHEVGQGNSQRNTNAPQLCEIYTPLPPLHLANERLVNLQPFSKLNLRDPKFDAMITKHLDEYGVVTLVKGASHHKS